MHRNLFFVMLVHSAFFSIAQPVIDSLPQTDLDEIIVASTRIDLPLSRNSRFIQILTKETIIKSGATNLPDLLQQVAGLDIRRRGVAGMQADLYIRGGGFDQTLLLVDGIKLDDAQTGHHLMNFAPPIDAIERIEIIKGPAARIFGQNAFTGAINIVTKTPQEKKMSMGLQAGSFNQFMGHVSVQSAGEKGSILGQYQRHTSDGYRYNSDFKNDQVFLKGHINTAIAPLDILAGFNERKFGANGFYALPSYAEQYEETQASIIGIQTQLNLGEWHLRPRLYWRRGQDMYLFLRDNPSFYRNLHQTNKYGFALDSSLKSDLGQTGLGIDLAQATIQSNNLGNRKRFTGTFFAEHQFSLLQGKLSATPGIALTQYSDFDTFFFPGIDFGFAIQDHFQIFANVGYTYRIPTFTDLYYSDPTTLGNENLSVEEALTEEIGLRWIGPNIQVSSALFYRAAENLIDYVQLNEGEPFKAINLRAVNTLGIEWEAKGLFYWHQNPQRWSLGYTYLNDDLVPLANSVSRYSLTSMRHHLTLHYRAQWTASFSTSFQYVHIARPTMDPYNVLDIAVQLTQGSFQFHFTANNIFNEIYTETNLVPMPQTNGMLGVRVFL